MHCLTVMYVINENSNILFLLIESRDFFIHHGNVLGLSTTILILVKSTLDEHDSELMLNKKNFHVNEGNVKGWVIMKEKVGVSLSK